MKMVGMCRIIVRAEDGREQSARAFMHLGKEAALRRIAPPIFQYADSLTIDEIKPGNVDRIAPRMAAAAASLRVVHIAAGISAVMPDAVYR